MASGTPQGSLAKIMCRIISLLPRGAQKGNHSLAIIQAIPYSLKHRNEFKVD